MEKDIYRSQFRMPQELFERLKASADANHRSVNAELVVLLHEALGGGPKSAAPVTVIQPGIEEIAERAAAILEDRYDWMNAAANNASAAELVVSAARSQPRRRMMLDKSKPTAEVGAIDAPPAPPPKKRAPRKPKP